VTAHDRLLTAAVEHFAEHGIGDTSLRGLAAALGTSHRMLIYHFGSRDGLLAEVVRTVEAQQRETLAAMAETNGLGLEQSMVFWEHVVAATLRYGRLFFELSAYAMQGRAGTEGLRRDLIGVWVPPLTELFVRLGVPPAEAPARARLGLAASRGLLFDLLISGDRAEVDEAAQLMNRLLLP
jgi:AcrR family transcriptional regulator